MARTQSGESVLSRAVRLVEAFRQGEEWLTVTELARRTGLPPFDGRVENQVLFTPAQALVTTIGHVQAEGVCVLHALNGH